MTWTIYTFGDGDLIARVLQAVALMVNGGLGSLTRAAMLVGIIVALGLSSTRMLEWPRLAGWFIGALLVFVLLIQVRTTVTVEDVVDTRIAPQVVGDIPLLFAVPASVASEVSYRVTLLSTSLELGGQMGSGLTLLRPTTDLQALMESSLGPGDLRANLINYLHECVVHPGSGISPVNAANNPDLLQAIASNNVVVMLPFIQNGEVQGAVSCADMYTQYLLPPLDAMDLNAADPGLRATLHALACRVTGGRALLGGAGGASCSNPPAPWSELDDALQNAIGGLVPAQRALATVLIAKLWPEAEMDLARQQQDPAMAMAIANDGLLKQLELQAKTGQEVSKAGLLRQVRALADGMVYLGGPLLLAMAATPFVWKGLGLYLRLFVWLALWGPLQALANFIVLSVSMSDLSSQTTMLAGITMGNLHELFTRVVQANAIGYDVLIAVPGVALAIAWGGVGALGGALSGAAGGVLATGQDVRRRVESGDEVLASSLAKPRLEAGMLRRPPNMGGLSTADWQSAWGSTVVSHGLQSTTMRLPDGRAITTMQNGAVRVTGAGNDYTILSNGFRAGTQFTAQSVEVRGPQGSWTVPAGALIQWRGNAAQVQLPSRKDPLTKQEVTPVAVFAQDPSRPDGLGPLMQTTYEVTHQGLRVQAAQGPDGKITYHVSGRTDGWVVGADGERTAATMEMQGTVMANPDGRGGYDVFNGQATVTYVTPNGQRVHAEGPFALPGMQPTGALQRAINAVPDESWRNGAWGGPVFYPSTGEASNQRLSQTTHTVEMDGVSVPVTLRETQGPDGGRVTEMQVAMPDGRTITATLPSVSPNAKGPVSVSARVNGYLRDVELGGWVPQGAGGRRVDVPLRDVAATATVNPLVLQDPKGHVTDLVRTLMEAPMQLVQVEVPDPTDPARRLQVSGVLTPPGSTEPSEPRAEVNQVSAQASATQSELPDGTPVVHVREVQVTPKPHWALYATDAHSQSTQPISVEPPAGALFQGGHFEIVGETKITNNQLHGRFATVTYVAPNGAKQVLGAGEVIAQRDEHGGWRVVSLKTSTGVDMVASNTLQVNRVEQIAAGVEGRVTGVVDPATGDWVTKRVEIGVWDDNLQAVRRAFQTGPITPQPGGTLTIDNTGAVSYRGPAEVTLSYERDGKRESVTASVVADVRGARSQQKDGRQVITWQSGTVEQTLEGKTTTEALPKELRPFFARQQGGPGKAQVTLAPDGRALAVDARAGTESTVKDTRRVDVGTLHIESSSAYALAYQGNSRLGDEIVSQPDPTKRYTTAMQIVRPLAEEATKRVQKTLTAEGSTALSGGLGGEQLQEWIQRYAGKGGWLGKLAEVASNVVSLKAERSWSDRDIYNFFYSELMRMYRAREEDVGKNPAAFVKGFTEDLRQFATSLEREVMSQTPNRYGADAVRGWADAGGQTIREYALEPAAKAAGDLAEAAGRGVQQGISALTGQPAAGAAPVPGSSARPAEASPTPSGAPPAQGAPAGPASSSASPPRPAKASTESTPAPGAAPANGPSTGPGGHADSKPDSEAVRLVQQHLGAHAADKGAFSTATHQFIRGELDEGSYRAQVFSAFRQAFAPPDKHPTERQLNEADAKAEEFLAVVREARRTYADKRQQPAMTGGSSPARSADGHAGTGARAGGAGIGTASSLSSESAGRTAQEVAPDKTSRAAGQAPVVGSSAGSSSGAGQTSAPSEPPRESRPSAPPRDMAPGSTADRAVDGRQAAPDRAEPRASSADRSSRVEPGRADAGTASAGTSPAPSAPRDPFAGIQRPPDGAFTRTPQDDTSTKGDKFLALHDYAARLMGKVHKGELTLEEVKRELQRVDQSLKPGTTLHGLNWSLTF
jgi:hypothetical protein